MRDDQLEIARKLCLDFDRLTPDEKWRALIDALVTNQAMRDELNRIRKPKGRRGPKPTLTVRELLRRERGFRRFTNMKPSRTTQPRKVCTREFRKQFGNQFNWNEKRDETKDVTKAFRNQLSVTKTLIPLFLRYIRLLRRSPPSAFGRVDARQEVRMALGLTSKDFKTRVMLQEFYNEMGFRAIASSLEK